MLLREKNQVRLDGEINQIVISVSFVKKYKDGYADREQSVTFEKIDMQVRERGETPRSSVFL